MDDHKEVDCDDNVRCSTSSHLTQISACGSLIAGCQETDRCSEECNYSGGGRHAYGSVSAGREKWPFNVLFFLKVEPPCDQT